MFNVVFAAVAAAFATVMGRVLIAAGLGLAVYTLAFPTVIVFIQNTMGGSPVWFLQVACMMKLDQAITVVASAAAVKTVSRVVVQGSN